MLDLFSILTTPQKNFALITIVDHVSSSLIPNGLPPVLWADQRQQQIWNIEAVGDSNCADFDGIILNAKDKGDNSFDEELASANFSDVLGWQILP